MNHHVTFKEQKNNDRYDCWHANCSCGWHGQAPALHTAVGLGADHANRRGGTYDASETGVVRAEGKSKSAQQAQKGQSVGSVREVDGAKTAQEVKPHLVIVPKAVVETAPSAPATKGDLQAKLAEMKAKAGAAKAATGKPADHKVVAEAEKKTTV